MVDLLCINGKLIIEHKLNILLIKNTICKIYEFNIFNYYCIT